LRPFIKIWPTFNYTAFCTFIYTSFMKYIFKTLAFCLALLASGHSYALFRCGNVFQDRPCDSESAQKAAATLAAKPKAGSSEATAAAAAKGATVSPFAMECAKLGKSSMEISWKREAGALREAQSAKGSSEHKKLVDSVYDRRGSAPEIKAAIEAECISERQHAADAAAAIAAIAAQGGLPTVAASPVAAAAPTAAAAAPAPAAASASASKNDNAVQCAKLNIELTTLKDRARQGGSVSTMERINNERRTVDSKISAARC
jgi:hypothetical protein